MKAYLTDILPKLQRFSKKLDNLTILTNQHWVLIERITEAKYVYIFRSNNELLISKDGRVEKARWEYLGNNSLLIDRKDESLIFKHGFVDENVLAIKIDSKEKYAIFINESKYNNELNSIDQVAKFLYLKYLSNSDNKTDKTISQKQKPLPEKMSYEILKEGRYWDLFKGNVKEYFISFNYGQIKDSIIFVPRKEKYGFFIGNEWKYFEDMEVCISEFYEFLRKKKS